MNRKDIRNWSALIHISAFALFVIPFGNILIPLLLWQLKKDESPLITDNAKEAINYQITYTIALIISAILVIVLMEMPNLLIFVFFPLIFPILATIKTAEGKIYRYPFSYKFIK
jgi:uncharacterized Tic20 family protein